jgi:hypothetical protein
MQGESFKENKLTTQSNRINLTSPVGRLVQGDLYRGYTKDAEGKDLVYKNGADAGKARTNFFFALAIPKNPGETHWANTEWGAKILQVGAAAFPQMYQNPAFSWKVEDGDSNVPNKKGKVPSTNEGWKGNWIIKFSTSIAPKVFRAEGSAFFETADVKCGYYVQVNFDVQGNESAQNPGVYINPTMVCFRAPGEEISFGPNVEDAGFGAAPLPVGVTAAPLPVAMPAAPSLPVAAPSLPVAVPSLPVAAPAIPALNVQPNPGFLQGPAASTAAVPSVPLPAAVPAMIPSPSKRMTAKAAGATYEMFIAANWTDAQMIAQGYLEP